MTDRDVVERVAAMFGTAVMAIDKGKYRTEFAATLKGEGAVAFMRDIKPMMGERRQEAIDSALSSYHPATRKLNFDAAEEIRRRAAAGESVASLARAYAVARQTIYPILDRRIYAAPPSRPWRDCVPALPPVDTPPWMSSAELHWLAGWLEGEGSFQAPPPSKPACPRISAQARDRDVVAEAGRLLQVKSTFEKARRQHWSPIWRVLLQGRRAIAMMLTLEPLMGKRRREQIQGAIAATAREASMRVARPKTNFI
jgi:Helix-turn-helix domain of resolvase